MEVKNPLGEPIVVLPQNDMPSEILVVMHTAPFNDMTNYFKKISSSVFHCAKQIEFA